MGPPPGQEEGEGQLRRWLGLAGLALVGGCAHPFRATPLLEAAAAAVAAATR